MPNHFKNVYWDLQCSFRSNAYRITCEYIPYEFNFLSQKKHIAEARALKGKLMGRKSNSEVYSAVMSARQKVVGAYGEFCEKLDFMIACMEEYDPSLKSSNSLSRAIKTVFNFS